MNPAGGRGGGGGAMLECGRVIRGFVNIPRQLKRRPVGAELGCCLSLQNTMRSPSASPQIDSPRASMLLANARLFGGPTPSPLGMSSRANKENDAGEAPQSGGQPPISPSGVSGAISPAGTGHGRSLSASVASGFRMRKPRELHLDEDSPAVSLYREELCKVKAFKVRRGGCAWLPDEAAYS